jgi:DNA polymerase IV
MALEFPITYLLPAHLGEDERQELEDQIPSLTYDINEAEVVVGKLSRKERALFELRQRKLITEEVSHSERSSSSRVKRRKISDSTETTSQEALYKTPDDGKPGSQVEEPEKTVKVVKLSWLTDSLKNGTAQPFDAYLVYEGRRASDASDKPQQRPRTPPNVEDILKRAIADGGSEQTSPTNRSSKKPWRRNRDILIPSTKPPPLVKQTTTEHDEDLQLPPIPDYLHTTYSCQRPTPVNPPNESFIEQLKKIRTTRTLIGDKIGVRAYSSAIATLAAYPFILSSSQGKTATMSQLVIYLTLTTCTEVSRLPGCGPKIAVLFQEYKETGQLQEALDAEADPKLSILRMFYDIWGVAETSAREFYNKGWRDLDDIVEYGWDSLTRVQQIGVKYYDEFLLRIPRGEVESISNIILEHANKIHPGFQMVIVGGYRRGKKESGDVDLILSHPDEATTQMFVEKIVLSLEKEKYITHTLTLSTKNSERGQVPVAWKGNDKRAGAGFDTLDKAMVVWQNPDWSGKEGKSKNPNPHRRVDIIVSPWKTVGCAVLGWTSGTTFQRDLRRYCKKELGLKFDSSGIRSRTDGSWVDLQSGQDGAPAPDMLTAERRIFAGLSLEWRSPEERCTG